MSATHHAEMRCSCNSVKPNRHDGPRRFGGVAVTPLIGCEFVADVGFGRVDAFQSDAAVADEALIVFQHDGELIFGARLSKLLREEQLHELFDVLRRTIEPVGVTQITRIALISQHGEPVRLDEFAQDQTVGGELHGGFVPITISRT